ncbi:MAG: YfiR family protein [Bacteroidales bacterium]|nr:YfiR family protein [Bacteroidales bacterium]
MRLFFLGLFLCFSITVYSQNERFKSLFIYKFSVNVEWPVNYQQGNFTITVLGKSSMISELQHNVKGKKVGNQIIQISEASNISGIGKCNILYIPAQQSNLLEAARKHLSGKPTLIVTEKRGMIMQGADINISQTGGKLQFEVNPKQVQNKGLKLSKTLLDLGIVYDSSGTIRKIPELESVDDTSVPR